MSEKRKNPYQQPAPEAVSMSEPKTEMLSGTTEATLGRRGTLTLKHVNCSVNDEMNLTAFEANGLQELLNTRPASGELVERLTEFYNEGYKQGHHDTVESCYTQVLPVDMKTYHSDVVADLIEDHELMATLAQQQVASGELAEELRGAIKQAEQQIEQQKSLGYELVDEGFALPLLRRSLAALTQPGKVSVSRECEWWPEAGEYEVGFENTFEGKCGVVFIINDGGPAENKMHFCPQCGGKIKLQGGEQ